MPKATTTDGVELYYETMGNPEAQQKIIFVMGLSGAHRGWAYQSQYFASLGTYHILVFDNRGAAFSQSPPAPYTMERMAEDVIFLANQVTFERFHLVGVSMGGMISHHVALAIPERIVSLSLLVTRTEGGFFKHLPTFAGIIQFLKMSSAKTPEAILEAGIDLLFPPVFLNAPYDSGRTYRDKVRAEFIKRSQGVPVQPEQGRKGQLAAIRNHGLTPTQMAAIKSAKFPILSIVGDLDILVKPEHSYNMPAQIGADLLIIEGAGHGVIQQCPDMVNEALQRHFEWAASGKPRNTTPEIHKLPAIYQKPPTADQPAQQPAQQQADADALAEPIAVVEENLNL